MTCIPSPGMCVVCTGRVGRKSWEKAGKVLIARGGFVEAAIGKAGLGVYKAQGLPVTEIMFLMTCSCFFS